MTFSLHVGKSIDIGPLVVFSAFDAPGSPNNVVDGTSAITVECPSGKCRVGVLPGGRSVFVDGLTETSSPVSVIVRGNGVSASVLVEVLHPAAPIFPPAISFAGVTVGSEYDTPDER